MSRLVLAVTVGVSTFGACLAAAPVKLGSAQAKPSGKQGQAQAKQSARQAGEQHLQTALQQTQAKNAQGAIQSLAAAVQAFDAHHKAGAGKGPHPGTHPHIQSAAKHLQEALGAAAAGKNDKANKDFAKAASLIQEAIVAHAPGNKNAPGGKK